MTKVAAAPMTTVAKGEMKAWAAAKLWVPNTPRICQAQTIDPIDTIDILWGLRSDFLNKSGWIF